MLVRKGEIRNGKRRIMVAFQMWGAQVTDRTLKDWWEIGFERAGIIAIRAVATTGRTSKAYSTLLGPGKQLLVLSIGKVEIARGLFKVVSRSPGWEVENLGSPSRKIIRREAQ